MLPARAKACSSVSLVGMHEDAHSRPAWTAKHSRALEGEADFFEVLDRLR